MKSSLKKILNKSITKYNRRQDEVALKQNLWEDREMTDELGNHRTWS